MQNANFGRVTAAAEILKTSTSSSNLKKILSGLLFLYNFFFHLQERYAKKVLQY